MSDWRDRAVSVTITVATLAAFAVFLIHAWVALRGAHLSFTAGIWLSSALDLKEGVLYRPLSSDLGYGGTRYFPLFFAICAAFLRFGTGILAAGWLGVAISLAVLLAAMWRLMFTLGVDRRGTWLFLAAVIAPYFVQQTAFEIRADVLATGLNLFGLAHGLRFWTETSGESSDATRRASRLSALFFVLAFATKLTSLWAPAALVVCGLLGRRRSAALRLAALVAVGIVLVLVVIVAGSQGRAIEAWSSMMFAGSTFGSTMSGMTSGGFLVGLAYSRVLFVLLILAIVVPLAAGLVRDRTSRNVVPVWVAFAMFCSASFATAFILSSPGTVPGNQMSDWIVSVWLILAAAAMSRPPLRRLIFIGVAVLIVWMSEQDLVQSATRNRQLTPEVRHARTELVNRIAASPGPILSDSALWPALAGRTVIVPDAFAFRIVARVRPDLESDLIARIRQREFPFVVLEFDPASPEGLRMYGHAHLTPAVAQAVLESYRLESTPLENALIYVPK